MHTDLGDSFPLISAIFHQLFLYLHIKRAVLTGFLIVSEKKSAMEKESIVSNVKALIDDYTLMDYISPALLLFGACTLLFFLLFAIFGNEKVCAKVHFIVDITINVPT